MRIVSLLPAATEWICEFGGAHSLVARSHECDYPPEIRDRPVVTGATYEADGDSAAIDRAVADRVQQGLSLYDVDLTQLRSLEPDLIVTQDQCDVCAVSRPELEAALSDWGGGAPDVFSMEPTTLKEVLDDALRLGRAVDRLDEAMETVANLETGLRALRNTLGVSRRTNPESLPSVLSIEWLEPLMVAGHWMPDVVRMAGGNPVLADSGERTRTVEWSEIRRVDPDVIVCMPCGFTIDETRRDLSYLTDREGWGDLSAVRDGRVALLDGTAYYNRPGPRLYRSIDVLASVLHAEYSSQPSPADWEREWLQNASQRIHEEDS